MHLLLTLVLVLSGCKWQGEEATVAAAKKAQDIGSVVSDISGEYVCPQKIDVADMYVDFLGAGVQTTRSGRFVRLFFNAYLCRDYLEIMRCKEEKRKGLTCSDGTSLFVPQGSVQDRQAMLNSPHGSTVNRARLRDCWNSIAQATASNSCVLLGGYDDGGEGRTGRIYAAEHFIDATAPAGQEFFYLARVCVHADRADELTSGNDTCSQRLHVSNVVSGLEQDEIDNAVLAAREKVAALAARLNHMTERAYRITLKFSEVLDKQQENEIARERSKRFRQGIAVIAGMAVGAMGAVYTGGSISSLSSGLDAGQALGAAFADVIVFANDYPKTCTECLQLQAELIEVVGDYRGVNFDPFNQEGARTAVDAAAPLVGGPESRAIADSIAGATYHQVLVRYEDAISELAGLLEEKQRHDAEGRLSDADGQGGPL